MIAIAEKSPLQLPAEQCPAFPYPQYRPIQTESDVPIALRDQVERLGSDFDTSMLTPFYRFVWLLNTKQYKSLQGYLAFRPDGIVSDVLVGPFDGDQNIVTDLNSVKLLSSEFASRFQAAAVLQQSTDTSVWLTPIPTKFGQPPSPINWGFSLGIKIVSFDENPARAVSNWTAALSALVGPLTPTSVRL